MIRYLLANDKYLVIEDKVIELLGRSCPKINNIETGGILLGKFNVKGNYYIITRAIEIPNISKKMNEYEKDIKEANEKIASEWELSKGKVNYLGEWHTHNEAMPKPSSVDLNTMSNIISRKDSWDERFLFILGTSRLYIGAIYKENNIFRQIGGIKL